VGLGQAGQGRAGDDLADLEQIDRHHLAAAQGKQQEREGVCADVIRGHINLLQIKGVATEERQTTFDIGLSTWGGLA
jgi:phage terminase Nu1 subunit (DNA packaging protein)